MVAWLENDFERYFAKILATYRELGYPHELIGQWTLPQRDAQTLMGIIKEAQPQNILEVGTFVGVTTLLMALMSSPETHIHSIDPNFPLKVEMESMKSKLYDFDTSIKAHDLALRAARKLGVATKITFHEGGFSTGNTFASYNTFPASRVSPVGPEVCKNHGPFDFIFVDGLHYEDDVFADISLAADNITPAGAIAIHDVLGRWGSNVRRAVFRFLENHQEYHFSHDNFSKLYETIGLLKRHSGPGEGHYPKIDTDIRNKSLFQARLMSSLAALLVNIFSPSRVVQLGGDLALSERLQHLGVPEICGFVLSPQEIKDTSFPVKVFEPDNQNIEERYDICLCFEMADELSHEYSENLINACVNLSDNIIFAASPPGEMGAYQKNNQPLAYWIRKFFKKGYFFSDIIRPLLEPHVEATFAETQQNSTYLMNLYLVKKEPKLTDGIIKRERVEDLLVRKESRIEDLQLQNLYQRCIIDHERQARNRMHQEYLDNNEKYQKTLRENRALNEQIETINIFNRKVIQNTVERMKEILFKTIRKCPPSR